MGNKESEFEHQFYRRYTFIQCIEDKQFGLVKIYRKNSVKFDYIMILQVHLQSNTQQQVDLLNDRLRYVRNYQNETTLRIYYYRMVQSNRIECAGRRMLIYAEYMNRSIHDYLCALRSSPRFTLDITQIIYVLRNVAKSCITLKKMGITMPDLSAEYVYLSPEGEALLCPLLYVLTSLKGSVYYNQVNSLQSQYQKYSITYKNNQQPISHFPLRNQFTNLLLEMTGNLNPKKLHETTFLYHIIQQAPDVELLFARLPEVENQTVKIQQMHTMQSFPGQFYQQD